MAAMTTSSSSVSHDLDPLLAISLSLSAESIHHPPPDPPLPPPIRVVNFRTGEFAFDIPLITLNRPGVEGVNDILRYNECIIAGEMRAPSRISIYDLRLNKYVKFLDGHTDPIFEMELLESDGILGSTAADHTVRVWNMSLEGEETHCFEGGGLTIALCFLSDRRWLCGGGMDKTVTFWDLEQSTVVKSLSVASATGSIRQFGDLVYCAIGDIDVYSPETFTKVRTFHPTGGRIHALCGINENQTFLSGSSDGAVSLWDCRHSEKPIFEKTLLDGKIHQIVPVGDGLWACRSTCSSGRTVSVWNQRIETISEFQFSSSKGYCVTGMCYLGNEASDSSRLGDFDDRISVLQESGILNLKLETPDKSGIETSRSLMCCSPLVVDDDSKRVRLEQNRDLSPEVLLSVLLGVKPPAKHLPQLYLLFRELAMVSHAFVTCKMASSVLNPAVLVGMSRVMRDEIRVDPIETSDLLDGSSLDPVIPDLKGFDPFAVAVLQGLARLRDMVMENVRLCRSLPPSVLAILHSKGVNLVDLESHPSFSGLSEFPMSFASAFRDTRLRLWRTRECSNVILVTDDGGREEAHVEILVIQSEFFFRMLNFEGRELESLKTDGEIRVENFSHVDLVVLLRWIYTQKLSEDDSLTLATLIRLLVHGHMFDESSFVVDVQGAIVSCVGALDSVSLLRTLMELTSLYYELPDELQSWLVVHLPSLSTETLYRGFFELFASLDRSEQEENDGE